MSKTSADYLVAISDIKTDFLDGLWNATSGYYEVNEGEGLKPFSLLNAFTLQTIAILAGQGEASTGDIARAKSIAEKFVTTPAYSNDTATSGTWTELITGGDDIHEAIDQPVAESLYYAYIYRTELGLSSGTISDIYDILTVDQINKAYTGEYPLSRTYPDDSYSNQDQSKWTINRLTYGKLLLGNSTLDSSISNGLKRFIYYMDHLNPATGDGVREEIDFFPDWGWNYTDIFADWNSFEYSAMSFGGAGIFYPEIKTAAALTTGEKDYLKAWGRSILGQWMRNGYPNWDTSWSNGRMWCTRYWMWSIRFLNAVARNSGELNQGTSDHLYAKWMLDAAIDTWFSMDTWKSDPEDSVPPATHFTPKNPYVWEGTNSYNSSKAISAAQFVMELAMAIELGVADQSSADPGNLWTWMWDQKSIHVSTPIYSAASLPFTNASSGAAVTGWGTDAVQLQNWGISRIQLPSNNKILTAFGGSGDSAFHCRVERNTTKEIDTAIDFPTTQKVYREGSEETRSDYYTIPIAPTFTTLREVCSGAGSNYSLTVDTTFFENHIDTKHTIAKVGTQGSVKAYLSIPSQSGVTVQVKKTDDSSITIWNGTAASSVSLEEVKYIHQYWADGNGLLWIPFGTMTVSTGNLVSVDDALPATSYSREVNRDRSTFITLADTASVDNLELSLRMRVTDGTASGADAGYLDAMSWYFDLLLDTASDTYTKGFSVSLPTGYNDLTTFTQDEYTNIASDNGSYVNLDMTDTGYYIFQFKLRHTTNTDKLHVIWNGKSILSPGTSTLYLQIFNHTDNQWETIDTDSTSLANTDLTLENTITTSLSEYYDASNWVICRVYQQYEG